jgi:Tol biopolymer transport system component
MYGGNDPLPTENIDYDQIGGGKILFTGNATYFVDADTRTTTVMNTGGAGDFSLSPDATLMSYRQLSPSAFDDSTATGADIFVSRLDGGQELRAAAFQGNIEGPAVWTPSGRDIVFATFLGQDASPSTRPTIYRQAWNAPGSRRNIVTFPTGPNGEIECPTLFPAEDLLSVAPTGQIAFTCINTALYVVTPEAEPRGHGTVRLVYALPASARNLRQLRAPAWSPDGTRIAYFDESTLSDGAPRDITIRIIDVATGVITTVATVPYTPSTLVLHLGTEWSMCWRAGGTRLLLTMPDDFDSAHLYAVAVTGGQPVRVTSRGNVDRNVSCAP